ncbi:hypothetical protein [Micrococcus lacusdianchii]|uniref:hypothetical protein n=1 Tax=Micrococcus lacusdianchii TaxID=2915940 RepID=UPI002003B5DD|nr:hypothetical protein [Micrococcus sp. JXJ CY 30]
MSSEEAAVDVEAEEAAAEFEAMAPGVLDSVDGAAMVDEEDAVIVGGAGTSSSAAQPVATASAAMAPVVRSKGVRGRVMGPPKQTANR